MKLCERTDIIKKSLDFWGSDSQIIKFLEENGELTKVLCKYLLYKDLHKDWKGDELRFLQMKIREEIADTIITMQSLIEIFDIKNDDQLMLNDIPLHWNIYTFIVHKLERLNAVFKCLRK